MNALATKKPKKKGKLTAKRPPPNTKEINKKEGNTNTHYFTYIHTHTYPFFPFSFSYTSGREGKRKTVSHTLTAHKAKKKKKTGKKHESEQAPGTRQNM